jgi:uncharacterized protein DUF4012
MTRRVVSFYVFGVLLVFAVLGALTFFEARRAQANVRSALREIDSVRGSISLGDIEQDPGATLAPLERAHADLETAHSQLASPWILPVRGLPVIGRQLRAGITLADGASQVVGAAIDAVSTTVPLLHDAAPSRLIETLDGLEAELSRVSERLDRVSLPPPSELVAPLRDADVELSTRVAEARSRVRQATDIVPTIRSTLGATTPRHYFLAVNNNAEMRGMGGMTLSYGILTFDHGRFSVDNVRSSFDLRFAPVAPPIALPSGYAKAFGWLLPTQDVRNAGASALFPEVAPIIAQMYKARSGNPVDGVISVDVVALQELVQVLGPVTVPQINEVLSGNSTVDILLSKLYRDFPDDNETRREALGSAAKAVASRLDRGGFAYGEAATHLAQAVRERHVMMWSAVPGEQQSLDSSGLTGAFSKSAAPILAAVENIGANKLDYYLSVSQDIDLSFQGPLVAGTLTVTISNPTMVDDLPAYVVGPNEGLAVDAGTYRALVSTWLPPGAVITSLRGDAAELFRGDDGGYPLSTSFAEIKIKERRTATVTFVLNVGSVERDLPLLVLPQGRISAVPLRINAHLGPGWSGPVSMERSLNAPVTATFHWRGQPS